MSAFVIRLIELASGKPHPDAGRYVKYYNPKGWGVGLLETTPDITDARTFPDAAEVFRYYQQEAGTRLDGKPNRPLTAWTVEVTRVEDGATTTWAPPKESS